MNYYHNSGDDVNILQLYLRIRNDNPILQEQGGACVDG